MNPSGDMGTPGAWAASAPRRAVRGRLWRDRCFVWFCRVTAVVSLLVLAVLLVAIVVQGAPTLTGRLLSAPLSLTNPQGAGIFPALMGSVWVCTICALLTLPLGVATAVYLEEFRPRNRVLRALRSFIQLNIANLAGVPSVVYGIIGLSAFVSMFGLLGSAKQPALEWGKEYYYQVLSERVRLPDGTVAGDEIIRIPLASRDEVPVLRDGMPAVVRGRTVELNVLQPGEPVPPDPQLVARTVRSDARGGLGSRERWYYFRLPLGRGVLAGALTLMLVVLPIVIIASQEALRAVPQSLREGALGLGATPWQVVRHVTLPAAIPGIMTGSILAMSRAIGEAAPILIVAGIVYITFAPQNLMGEFSVMPLAIYEYAKQPRDEFRQLAASGIIVLLAALLCFNALAVFVRQKFRKPLS
jgi:phosphate transport system permease protein